MEHITKLQNINKEIDRAWKDGQIYFANDGHATKYQIADYLDFLWDDDKLGCIKHIEKRTGKGKYMDLVSLSRGCQWQKKVSETMLSWLNNDFDDSLY